MFVLFRRPRRWARSRPKDVPPGKPRAPWARADAAGYAGGGNKFDLSKWDPAYVARLKDFVGKALDLPVRDRLEGTLATTAVSAWLGARVFRAHHVKETRRVLDMTAAILGLRPPAVSRRALA